MDATGDDVKVCVECGFSGQELREVRVREDGSKVHACLSEEACRENVRLSAWTEKLLVEANVQAQYEAGNALWAL